MEEIELVIKLVGFGTALVLLFIKFDEFKFNKRASLRADYEFAEKVFLDEKWRELPDYMLEKGYLASSGKTLDATSIKVVLELADPSEKFALVHKAKKYLTYATDSSGGLTFAIQNQYTSSRIARIKVINFIGYFSCAFTGSIPLIFVDRIAQNPENTFYDFVVLGVWASLFCSLAYTFLVDKRSLSSAERIIEQNWQKKN
ncbi:hypothetical protein RFM71_004435 [Vibrio parahaemolyticus]|uniref:hypothetical protein n=1 Tax=Vibrio parahaemolyticus TaxID=670 RepID=UPI001EEB30FC|nr:hypothetical protein [Vibrio parahaemolyticus]ELA3127179.1 hypothetical protein [Vibrio parahaemolyticus]MCG6435302.1 hypothetical protein [Vibrio parahaemolyticus]